MYKGLIKSFVGMVAVLLFAGQVFAAGNVSIRIEQPKSPTNQNSFNLVFVTLDIQGRNITVKCFKKGPSDGGFSQFGSDIAVADGGNTGNCPVASSIMNTNGTYQFYASATAGSDTASSTTDTVDFNTSGPGTPTDFGKDKINSCQYKISYKSADDAGKTTKVELYRSDNQTFNADSGTRVGSHSIGSNTTDSFTSSIPDCSKDYFFVLRAFDAYGNGSGLVGDASVTVTVEGASTSTTNVVGGTTGTTPTVALGGAIPVEQSQVQVTPGEEQKTTEETNPTGEVKGAATKENWFSNKKNFIILGLILLTAASVLFFFYNKSRKKI